MRNRRSSSVRLPPDTGFRASLDSNRLGSVRVVEHHTNGGVSRRRDHLNSSVLLGYMVAIGSGVAPFDLVGKLPIKAVDLKSFGTLT